MPTSKSADIPHRGDEPHLLREIVRTHQVLMAGFSRGVGMPASRFQLMRLLVNAEHDVGVMDLAKQLGINPAAITRHIAELEAEGLVRRRADPKDGRRSYIDLSPKGLRAFKAVHERTHELERRLATVIDANDIAVAVKVLGQLRELIENRRERP